MTNLTAPVNITASLYQIQRRNVDESHSTKEVAIMRAYLVFIVLILFISGSAVMDSVHAYEAETTADAQRPTTMDHDDDEASGFPTVMSSSFAIVPGVWGSGYGSANAQASGAHTSIWISAEGGFKEPDMDEQGGMLVPYDVAEEIARGPAGQDLREALESTGLSPTDEVIEEILESREPKVGIIIEKEPEEILEKPKKKSLYSRKLRTKRR